MNKFNFMLKAYNGSTTVIFQFDELNYCYVALSEYLANNNLDMENLKLKIVLMKNDKKIIIFDWMTYYCMWVNYIKHHIDPIHWLIYSEMKEKKIDCSFRVLGYGCIG